MWSFLWAGAEGALCFSPWLEGSLPAMGILPERLWDQDFHQCLSGDCALPGGSVSSTDFAWSQMSMRMCQGSSQRYQAKWALIPAATRQGLCSLTSVPEAFPSPFKLLGFPVFGICKHSCISCPHQPVPQKGRVSLHHQDFSHPAQSRPASDSHIPLRNQLLLFVPSSFLQSEGDSCSCLSTSHLMTNFPQKEGAGSPQGLTAGTRHLVDPGKRWSGPVSSGTV